MPRPAQSGDIVVAASVTARELRFRELPETSVEFTGRSEHESESGSDRSNLPDRVEPGRTYRDIRIDYATVSRLRHR